MSFKNGGWIYITVKTNRFGDEGNVFSLDSLVKSKQCHLPGINFSLLTWFADDHNCCACSIPIHNINMKGSFCYLSWRLQDSFFKWLCLFLYEYILSCFTISINRNIYLIKQNNCLHRNLSWYFLKNHSRKLNCHTCEHHQVKIEGNFNRFVK